MFPAETEFMDEDLAFDQLAYFAPAKPTVEILNELIASECNKKFHSDTPGGQYIRRKISFLRMEIFRRTQSYDKMLGGA